MPRQYVRTSGVAETRRRELMDEWTHPRAAYGAPEVTTALDAQLRRESVAAFDGEADMTEVSPRLFVGGAPYPSPWVEKAGYNLLVLAAIEYQPVTHLFRREGSRALGVEHCPLDDAPRPPTDEEARHISRAGRRAARVLCEGGRVLITCAQGRNRSVLLAACTIMLADPRAGIGRVIAQLRRRRPGALANVYHEVWLKGQWRGRT